MEKPTAKITDIHAYPKTTSKVPHVGSGEGGGSTPVTTQTQTDSDNRQHAQAIALANAAKSGDAFCEIC